MTVVSVLDEAALEIEQATEWYRQFDRDQSLRASLKAAFDRIGEFPEAGSPYFGQFRRVVLTDFPYAVVYRLRGTDAIVVALAHASRKPGYWIESPRR